MHNRLRIQFTKLFSVFLSLALISLSLPPDAALFLLPPVKAQSQQPKPKYEYSLEETTTPTPQSTRSQNPLVEGTALSPARTEEILKRLKPLKPLSEEKFILPEDSLIKPKLAGTETVENFPPQNSQVAKSKPDLAKSKPEALKVRNLSQTEDVEEIKHLTIGFSQPLVPLAKVDSISPAQFITLSPLPKGEWQWAGPQTAIFEPTGGRFPNSTKYTVTIPASTTSVTGNQLEKTVKWEIATPKVRAQSLSISWPRYPILCRKPVIVAHFDQAIETENLAKFIKLEVNEKLYPAKVLNKEDIQARNKLLETPIKLDEKSLAFEPFEELPPNQFATATFNKGISSAEGPLKSDFPSTLNFRVHGPLTASTITEKPLAGEQASVTVQFSNPLTEKSVNLKLISVKPAIENLKVFSYGYNDEDRYNISGIFKPFTTYRVKFAKETADIYGQTLGKDTELCFHTKELSPSIKQDFSLKTIPPGLPLQHQIWLQGAQKAEVKIYKVQPTDYLQYQKYEQKPIGTLISVRTVSIGPLGTLANLNLKPYLPNGKGQLVITARLLTPKPQEDPRTSCWIQVTRLGLDAYNGQDLQVLASDLKDGRPVKDVSIEYHPHHDIKVSKEDGLASFSLSKNQQSCRSDLLIARKGDDVCILAPSEYGGSWNHNELPGRMICWAVSDRKLYRPEEVAQIKGWFRPLAYEGNGAIKLSYPSETCANYRVVDSQENLIEEGSTKIDSHGGFSFKLALPQKVALGNARIDITPSNTALIAAKNEETSILPSHNRRKRSHLTANSHQLYIQIQEFRKPEFQMTVKSSAGQSLSCDKEAILTSSSTYLSGGTLNNAPIKWTVRSSQAQYTPPNWSAYQFTPPVRYSAELALLNDAKHSYKTFTGTTGADGKHSIKLALKNLPAPVPVSYECQATVTDVNRQQWTDSTSLLMHPSALYVGLKADKWSYTADEPIVLNLVATDLDGKIETGTQIDLEIATLLTDNQTRISKNKLVMGEAPITLKLPPESKAQSYQITATIHDGKGRINATEISRTIYRTEKLAESSKTTNHALSLTANAEEYQPGDLAEITVSTPFFPAQGLLFLIRNKIVSTLKLKVDGPKTTIKIPITPAHFPKLQANAYLIGKNGSFGNGSISLSVPPKERSLKLTITPQARDAAPGTETTINLNLQDSLGKAVSGGQIALAVVDESVLALSKYNWQDPMQLFYPANLGILQAVHSRQDVLNIPPITGTVEFEEEQGWDIRHNLFFRNPAAQQFFKASEQRDLNLFQVEPSSIVERHYVGGRAERHCPIRLRNNFSALALFNAAIETDALGNASVTFNLPDNITRYRIMAVAEVDREKFGSGESSINARIPLAIKPSPPRFLNLTDECRLPLLLHNQTDKPIEAEVVMRANGVKLLSSGKAVTIPANDRIEVDIPVEATRPGTAQFQCAVVADESSDAAEFSLPVLTPASSESISAYGSLDLPKEQQAAHTSKNETLALQKIETPTDVYENLGALTLTTSSTALQSLSDAYFYLRDYNYNCSEQISSRLIAMLSLQDTLVAFGLLKTDDLELFKSTIIADIKTLEKRQTQDGGFGLWSATDEKHWPYVSTQVTRALTLAKAKNYTVSTGVLNNALTYLKCIENFIPPEYGAMAKFAIAARAINVRHLAGISDSQGASSLLERARTQQVHLSSERKDTPWLSLETAAWLLPILAKSKIHHKEAEQLRIFINRQIQETASTATVNDEQSPYGDWGYCLFTSARRTDAAILEALLEDQPESPIIPKLAKSLLAHRKNGAWEGTQENGYILQALDKYFHAYENTSPDFSVRVWLDDTLMANQKFAGHSTESKTVRVPMQYLQENKPKEILIEKSGQGRLYYRLGLNYVPKNFILPSLAQGFKITRTYEAIDDKNDVSKDKNEIWHFKAGANIKVKIHFEAPGSRYHVALADPLPAGAEIMNTALVGTRKMLPPPSSKVNSNDREPGDLPFLSFHRYWWQRPWYEHQNLRDHQAEAFSSLLYAGAYDYDYIIQATTPGSFVIPPCKIEEMYMSETFGRTTSEKVVIE